MVARDEREPGPLLLLDSANVAAADPKTLEHLSSNVLVGKKLEGERLHAVVFRSQTSH